MGSGMPESSRTRALPMTVLPLEWCRNSLLDMLLVAMSDKYDKSKCSDFSQQLLFLAEVVAFDWDPDADALMNAEEFKATHMYKVFTGTLLAWLCELPVEKVLYHTVSLTMV
jgi:hypothetical protein